MLEVESETAEPAEVESETTEAVEVESETADAVEVEKESAVAQTHSEDAKAEPEQVNPEAAQGSGEDSPKSTQPGGS